LPGARSGIIAKFAPSRLADAYAADIRRDREPANALFNLADLLALTQMPKMAADLYRLGLDKDPAGRDDGPALARTAAMQYRAVKALAAIGDRQRALSLLHDHLDLLARLRERFGGADPKVRAAFEFFRRLYIVGGVDDVLNERPLDGTGGGRDYFVGGQLRFNDEDLKSILPFVPASAAGGT